MIKINIDNVMKMKRELTEYEGVLPFQFYPYISAYERYKYLNKIGKWDNILNQEMILIKKLRSSNKPKNLLDDFLKQWIIKNIKYESLISN